MVRESDDNRLFVGNIPFAMTSAEIQRLFGQVGEVRSVHLPIDRTTSRPRGFGFVQMDSPMTMEQAIRMFNGYYVDGRPLVVNEARPRD